MRVVRCALLLAAAAACYGCNQARAVEDHSHTSTADHTLNDLANEAALNGLAESKGGETYPEYNVRRNALGGSTGSYAAYGCTEDCSGHEAGYQWAEDHDITDPDTCGGTSWSFEEGCRAYAEDQSDASDEQSDDQSDDSDDPPE